MTTLSLDQPARRARHAHTLVMVRQRGGVIDGDAPWLLDDGRSAPGQDGRRRVSLVEAGLRRHPAVRAVGSGATDVDVERTLFAIHDLEYLVSLHDPGRRSRSARSRRHRRRGGANGDQRGRARRRRGAVRLCPLPLARPSGRPQVPRQPLLPQHGRCRRAHAARGRRRTRRHPRPRPALSERHVGDRRRHGRRGAPFPPRRAKPHRDGRPRAPAHGS